MLVIRALEGPLLDASLDQIARLRLRVFHDWPYLYDGDLAYERAYLKPYQASDRALVVGAFHGPHLVGAATACPLTEADDAMAAAFRRTGMDLDRICYFGESVLLEQYRGQRAGHAFFDGREAHARALGHTQACFCAVVRPDTHPMRPAEPRSLEAFWRGRGYVPMPGIVVQFNWTDRGEARETTKSLQVWMRWL